ncbi:methyltransferase [Roseospira visakhapatnamensis]|uniref:Demethylspheroidene O-methyltransferase n=1 Tax=Roseospira visakhapatnamensis TaxID=390880 RepID=A0A7W6RG33_9PROT|nr:demethylspheroidene O-methyltransferase [Roseospira visakhapatnamensis]
MTGTTARPGAPWPGADDPEDPEDRALHGLADWLKALRDRLIARPAIQRWAAGFPVVRWKARRRARDLFDLCAGFVYSQVLLAVVRLRLCEVLAEGPIAVPALARRLGLTQEATARLLSATTVLLITEPRSRGRHGLGELGAALLGNPSIGAMVEHHTLLYADLADPVALLRGEGGATALSRYWAYVEADTPTAVSDAAVAEYSQLMAASQALIADDILAAFPPGGARHWLDLGGGEGIFARAVATRAPRTRVTLFDLPAVAARADEALRAAGMAGRVTVVGGDFLADPLPAEADVVSLVRVIHDHDDADALAILRAARRAVTADGRLLIAEPMAGTRGAETVGGAYFGFYLLAMGRGRARTPAELRAMLVRAGFTDVRTVRPRQVMLACLLTARPAPADGLS